MQLLAEGRLLNRGKKQDSALRQQTSAANPTVLSVRAAGALCLKNARIPASATPYAYNLRLGLLAPDFDMFCKLLQIFVIFCHVFKILKIFAKFYKILQNVANFCKMLTFVDNFAKCLHLFAKVCEMFQKS